MLGETYDPEYVAELDAHLAGVDDVADHYAWSYVDFLERYRDRFGRAFAAVADADGAVVVHCMGGKDRTGLVAGAAPAPRRRRPRDDRRRLRALVGEPRARDGEVDRRGRRRRASGRSDSCSRTRPPKGWCARSRRSSAATATSRRTCAPPGSATPRSSGCGTVLSLLELRDVEARYGEIRALHGVSLTVDDGDFVADPRRERRRQDDDPACDLGHGQDERRRSLRGRARSFAAPPSRWRGGASRTFPRDVARSRRSRCSTIFGSARGCSAARRIATSRASSSSSRACTSAETSRPGRSPAASSRCSRSAAR